jgi:hypothetical protein
VKEIYMKRMAILNIFVLALLCIIGCSDSNDGPSPIPEKIVCDKFNVRATLDGQLLKVSVDTDLPDDTQLVVSVYRLLNIAYDQEEFSVYYFNESGTVGQWRDGESVVLDNYKLLLQLEDLKARWRILEVAKQRTISIYGGIPPGWEEELNKTYEVDKISDAIEVWMVVPIQSNQRFGYSNENLVGKAVSTKDLHIVEDEVQVHCPLKYPLKKSPTGRSSPDKKSELKGEALPSELMDKLKDKPITGNYRIIERNAYKTHWLVYDTKEYKENKDGYTLYPPTYCYYYTPNLNKKWDYEVFDKPEETTYVKNLTVVILKKDGKEIRKLTPKAITFKEAIQHIERVSSITKTKRLEDGTAIILGRSVVGKTVVLKPLWYYKRGSLYCINGAAKESTADIPFTYEVDAMTAFKLLED